MADEKKASPFDADDLRDKLGSMIRIDIPERGDLDELKVALS